MKRSWPKAVLFVSVLVVLGMVLNLWLRREPKYHGKTVSAWVDDLGDNPGHRQRFQLAMDEIGPAKACPFLLARLRREESVLRRRCQAVWPCLPAFLQRRFPLSRPLDCNTCETVGYVLRSSDSALTTTLMSALSDRTGGVRLAALTALRPVADQIRLSTVANLLTNSNGRIRELAVRMLGEIGVKSRPAIPGLIAALGDSDSGPEGKVAVRSTAAAVLGRMGPEAKAAGPALTRLLSDSDWDVRRQAATALWRISGDTNMITTLIADVERAIGPAATATSYPPEQMCSATLSTVMDLGPSAKLAVPAILQAIDVGSDTTSFQAEFHRHIQEAVAKIDPAAGERVGRAP